MENEEHDKNKLREKHIYEPLNIGEIIDRSIIMLKDNFKEYIILSSSTYGVIMILFIGFAVFVPFLHKYESGLILVLLTLIAIIGFPLAFIFSIFATKLSSNFYLGEKTSFNELVVFLGGIFWKLVTTMFLVTFIITFPVGVVVLFILFAITLNPGIWYFAMIVFISLLLIGAMIFFTFCFAMVPYIVMIEGLGGVRALGRSWQMFFCSSDSIKKIIVLPFMMQILLAALISFPYIGNIIGVMLAPLNIIAMTIVYYDIRIRWEAFDIELGAEQMAEKYRQKFQQELPI